ncbi:phosphoenolpyruvate synthase [Halobacillus litoralis]|uniref:phosphoenolpyruvate synthase n=1 Tax=Halobacillus litoralis TaxID=45668 RepID=UPI001CFDDE25|nr:phosphoenolpyruvate synthase [Halobacillus litoralis]
MFHLTEPVLYIDQVDRSSLALVGGKGANLGELSKAGFPVPGGFCVTTQAYQDFISNSTRMDSLLDELDQLGSDNLEQLRVLGKRIRDHFQEMTMPEDLMKSILHGWRKVGQEHFYAVRSSATAEDLPTASFAGQQDTFLNIKGESDLLKHIQSCWASLFTDRAISYRVKNNFDHRKVHLSVVVQRMVQPDRSGIMFTSDPVTGNRKVVSIDASFGLGEALVSGIVSADLYKVRENKIIEKTISEKKVAVFSLPEGGTTKRDLPEKQQKKQALTDAEILELARVGGEIENHYQGPQDIEFCFENGELFIVQSRPITSLFPLSDLPLEPVRVLISVGHVQVMTEAFKPLGISVFQNLLPTGFFRTAGGRLFLDFTSLLQYKIGRKLVIQSSRNMEESISRAISEFVERPEFVNTKQDKMSVGPIVKTFIPVVKKLLFIAFKNDPSMAEQHVEEVMKEFKLTVQQDLSTLNGTKRLKAVQKHLQHVRKVFLQIMPYPAAFIVSSQLLKKSLERVMGNDQEIYALTKSLPGNIMSQMGLKLGELADIVRNYPEVEGYLKTAEDDTFYQGLRGLSGSDEFLTVFQDFLDKYGMRGPGEIDITRPRWRESPTLIVPSILGDVRNLKEGESKTNFLRGQKEVEEAKKRIFEKTGDRGWKYKRMKRLIDVYRYMGGLREHHKHLLTIILDLCKQAILEEAEKLLKENKITDEKDVYYLSLDELIELSEDGFAENVQEKVRERKKQFEWHKSFKPPGVMTTEGEIIKGAPREGDFPSGALIGSPVSSGVVEGTARVISSPEKANLNEGEILVASHTDPGWTPLFQSAGAVVTEVGGVMTHGSVVAREYGLPAVVGVEDAMTLIEDGQKVRVDGDKGYVEVLVDEDQ